jgi:DNA-binding transcriptional LysR family regulator
VPGYGKTASGAQSGRLASEPKAVALDCALRFESPPNSWPSMVCLCRACFCRLLSSYRCCRSSRRLRRLITGRRRAGTATASCRAIISHRITAFQLTPKKLRFRAWRAATSALGISIQSQVITGTMATGTISAGLAFTVVATMAAASALAGRGLRSGRSGIAAD